MSVAQLYIYGEVNDDMVKMVEYQLDQQKGATSIVEHYNTTGGYVEDGKKLKDLLISYNLPRTAILQPESGKAMSIATIPFITAHKRIAYRSAGDKAIMMHLPFLDSKGHKLNAGQLKKYSHILQQMEDSITTTYDKVLTWDAPTISSKMKADKFLALDEAKEVNFLTEIIEDGDPTYQNNFKPIAKLRTENIEEVMDDKENSILKTILNKLDHLMKGKAAAYNNAVGDEVVFKDVKEGETPKKGDYATINNMPADGEHIMTSFKNQTFVFEKGILKEIKDPEEVYKKFAALKADNDNLTKSLQGAKAEAEGLKAQMAAQQEDHNKELKEIKDKVTNYQAKMKGSGVIIDKPDNNGLFTNGNTNLHANNAQALLDRITKNQKTKVK